MIGKKSELSDEKVEAKRIMAFCDAWKVMDFIDQKDIGSKLVQACASLGSGESKVDLDLELIDTLENEEKKESYKANITKDSSGKITISFMKDGKVQVGSTMVYDEKSRNFLASFSPKDPPKPMFQDLNTGKKNPRLQYPQQRCMYRLAQACLEGKSPSQLGLYGPASGKSWIQAMTMIACGGQAIYSVPKSDLADELIKGAINPVYSAFYGVDPTVVVIDSKFEHPEELKRLLERENYQIILTADHPKYAEFIEIIKGRRIFVDEAHQQTMREESLSLFKKMCKTCHVLALTGTPTEELYQVFDPDPPLVDFNTYNAMQIGKVRRAIVQEQQSSPALVPEVAAKMVLSGIGYRDDAQPTMAEHVKKVLDRKEQGKDSSKIAEDAVEEAMHHALYNADVQGFILTTDSKISEKTSEYFTKLATTTMEPKEYVKFEHFCLATFIDREFKAATLKAHLFQKAYEESEKKKTGRIDDKQAEVERKKYHQRLNEEIEKKYHINGASGEIKFGAQGDPQYYTKLMALELQSAQKSNIDFYAHALLLHAFLTAGGKKVSLKDIQVELKTGKIYAKNGILDKFLQEQKDPLPAMSERHLETIRSNLKGLNPAETKAMEKLCEQLGGIFITEINKAKGDLSKIADYLEQHLSRHGHIDLKKLGAEYIVRVKDVVVEVKGSSGSEIQKAAEEKEKLEQDRDRQLARVRCGLVHNIVAGNELATGTDIHTLLSTVTVAYDRESSGVVFVGQAQGRDKRMGYGFSFSNLIDVRTIFDSMSIRKILDRDFGKHAQAYYTQFGKSHKEALAAGFGGARQVMEESYSSQAEKKLSLVLESAQREVKRASMQLEKAEENLKRLPRPSPTSKLRHIMERNIEEAKNVITDAKQELDKRLQEQKHAEHDLKALRENLQGRRSSRR